MLTEAGPRSRSNPSKLLAHLAPYSNATELGRAVGVSPETIKQWADAGLFPKPIQLGRRLRWVTAEVVAYLEQQEANRG